MKKKMNVFICDHKITMNGKRGRREGGRERGNFKLSAESLLQSITVKNVDKKLSFHTNMLLEEAHMMEHAEFLCIS